LLEQEAEAAESTEVETADPAAETPATETKEEAPEEKKVSFPFLRRCLGQTPAWG